MCRFGSKAADWRVFGTHSPRWTKATLIYHRTGNLRAARLLANGNFGVAQRIDRGALPTVLQTSSAQTG
jgi:hypothetical protein